MASTPVAGRWVRLDAGTRLWLLAVLWFVVGDIATTVAGLSTPGVREVSPLLADVVARHGGVVLLAVKGVVLAGALVAWRQVRSPYRWGIPAGLYALGVAVTGWNTGVLLVATLG